MNGQIGDQLVLKGVHVGDPRRTGVIMDGEHRDGSQPYNSGRESLAFPGLDARIEASRHTLDSDADRE
jgi:Domain of unknown function (DUF1918)